VSRKIAPWFIALAAAAVTAVTAAPASAAIIDPAPIGPDQYFSGLVNGQVAHATIRMACFGPIRPGETGHPFAGQTVEALPAPVSTTSDIGFTGSAAHAIDVHFPTPTVANVPVTLRDYAVTAPIPVSFSLPCFGSGQVTFVPQPTRPTARPASQAIFIPRLSPPRCRDLA